MHIFSFKLANILQKIPKAETQQRELLKSKFFECTTTSYTLPYYYKFSLRKPPPPPLVRHLIYFSSPEKKRNVTHEFYRYTAFFFASISSRIATVRAAVSENKRIKNYKKIILFRNAPTKACRNRPCSQRGMRTSQKFSDSVAPPPKSLLGLYYYSKTSKSMLSHHPTKTVPSIVQGQRSLPAGRRFPGGEGWRLQYIKPHSQQLTRQIINYCMKTQKKIDKNKSNCAHTHRDFLIVPLG